MTTLSQNQSMVNASLYVGDLHPMANDNVLVSKFSEIGPVLTVRVCRDLGSRNSLGYGYVNFEDPRDAEKALELLNFTPIFGRPMRIMWSQRDPSIRKSGKGNIFIKNLDKDIDQKSFYDTFSTFGKVLSSKIAVDENGVSKGFGFVHYEKEESALQAIETVNNKCILKRQVYVGKFVPKNERKSLGEKKRFNNIYVKNFLPETDDQSLHDMFSEFGAIKSACIRKDADGNSKGFGFVCFLDPDHAEAAVNAMHNKEIGGRALYASRAQKKDERQEELKRRMEKQRIDKAPNHPSNVNLYVKNLDDNVDDKMLKDAFSPFGEITSAKVMMDADNRSRGFGFVCFAHPDQATKAVTDMNSTIMGAKPLFVALAQRKEDRRAKLYSLHQQRMAQPRNAVMPMIPAVGQQPAQNYYAAAPFQQTRFYHPTNPVLGSQPRWNRSAALAPTMAAQLNAAQNRPQMPHFAPNHPGAFSQNQLSTFAPLRAPNVSGRPLVPGAMQSLPAGHLLTGPVLNQNVNQRQTSARQNLVMQQVIDASNGLGQRPMQSVNGNVNAGIRQVTQSRPMMHAPMNLAGNAPRNMPVQPVPVPTNMFGPITEAALSQMSEKDQKRALGERLYPLVFEKFPEHAGKLTGMLIGVDVPEIIHMINSEAALMEKCQEGLIMIRSQKNPNDALKDDGEKLNGDNDAKSQLNEATKTEQLS